MKIAYYFILASGLFLMNCSAKSKSEDATEIAKEDTLKLPDNIQVKDPSLYSRNFLEGLLDYEGKIKIDGKNVFIDNEIEPAVLPDFFKQGTTYTFKGEEDGVKVEMNLTQINFTDVKYEVKISGKKNFTRSGVANVPGMFFLGAESFDVEDESVLAVQFNDSDFEKEDYISIYISDDHVNEGKLYGIVSCTINGQPVAPTDDILLISSTK